MLLEVRMDRLLPHMISIVEVTFTVGLKGEDIESAFFCAFKDCEVEM